MDLQILHKKIEEICAIYGIGVIDPNNKSTWSIHYVTEPTAEQLAAVKNIIDSYIVLTPEQESLNATNLSFLASTDWKVTRHFEQKTLGIPAHLTDAEYAQLLSDRQVARDAIIKEG